VGIYSIFLASLDSFHGDINKFSISLITPTALPLFFQRPSLHFQYQLIFCPRGPGGLVFDPTFLYSDIGYPGFTNADIFLKRLGRATLSGGDRMEKKGAFTRILAVAGTILTWFPILAPIVFSAIGLVRRGIFRFDYLMPAELFPYPLLGGLLLLWASLRAKSRVRLIGWGLGTAVVLFVGSQALAVVTGLANGTTDPVGWAYVVVLSALIVYALTLVVMGVGGVLLLRDVYKKETE
jgi:hypothetical protein